MSQLDIAITGIAAFVVLMGLWSKPIKKSFLQEPLIAVAAGVAIGPYCLGWMDISSWGETSVILEQAARITLAVALMGIALRLEKDHVRRFLAPAGLLLLAGMIGMWLASSAIVGAALGVSLWMALLIGAIVTPTDPVVASSIVTGDFAKKHLPDRIRHMISFESGANDGLAYALVFLPILMIRYTSEEAWQFWLVETLFVGIGIAVLIGMAIGYGAAYLLDRMRQAQEIENHSFLTFTVALSLLTLGTASLLKADALISVFVAGLVFNMNIDTRQQHEEENIQEAIAKLVTLPTFIIFGISLPMSEWIKIGWPLAAVCVLVLLLRRLPTVLAISPAIRGTLSFSDSLYVGWFGPIGVAALYYATVAERHLGDPQIGYYASAVIVSSIVAHGLTAAPLTVLRGKKQTHERHKN